MESRTMWFIGGLVVLAVLAATAPRIAGGLTVLVVIVLALQLAKKGLLTS
jgi:hypothetical protein